MKGIARLVLMGTALVFAPLTWAQGKQDQQAQSFLKQAAEANIAEVELGEVAQERAARKEVKEYAQHLQKEHKMSIEKLESIASKKDMELPDEPNASQKKMKERLSKLEGPAFDKAYLDAMVKDHQKNIKTFEQQAKSAKDPEVKQYASQTLPTLREHLKQAQQLQKQSQRQPQQQPRAQGQSREQSQQR